MKQGLLANYFSAVVAKRLSAVETDPNRSNQHEFNGSKPLQELLGTDTADPRIFSTRFIWVGEQSEAIIADGRVTWYDARMSHPTRTEFRLYFPSTEVSVMAREGDTLFIAQRPDQSLMMIVAEAGTSVEAQMHWLFSIKHSATDGFQEGSIPQEMQIDFSARFIFDVLGVDIEEPEADRLDHLVAHFEGKIPNTAVFSEFTRSTVNDVSPVDDPDGALIAWLVQEEKLFKRMERQLVANRIEEGFLAYGETDVDGFIQYSLSVQNRRKSRAGHAFEHHIAAILDAHSVKYVRGELTENRSKPDFLFPGILEYRNSEFPNNMLSMLGAKTTCKDRWRQVLTEAQRITKKHLLTLEPAISTNQTDEMRAHELQLVVPKPIHDTFQPVQQSWLMDVSDFIAFVKK